MNVKTKAIPANAIAERGKAPPYLSSQRVSVNMKYVPTIKNTSIINPIGIRARSNREYTATSPISSFSEMILLIPKARLTNDKVNPIKTAGINFETLLSLFIVLLMFIILLVKAHLVSF
nr:hypothetical protein A152_20910 [Vibrio tasmaniensis 1F-187]